MWQAWTIIISEKNILTNITDPGQCPAESSLTWIVDCLSGSFTVIGFKFKNNNFNIVINQKNKKQKLITSQCLSIILIYNISLV